MMHFERGHSGDAPRMKVRRYGHAIVLILAVMLSVASARAETAGAFSLDQLMTTLRTVRHVEARYIERHTLSALRTPLETRGVLRYDAPDRFEKVADAGANGAADRLTIIGNRLTIDRGANTAPVVILLNEHPEIGVLVDSIRATLSGDGAALRRAFNITLAGDAEHWQLVLQPRDPEQRDILQWMRITGYAKRISAIDTQEGDGDHSEMTIVEQKP